MTPGSNERGLYEARVSARRALCHHHFLLHLTLDCFPHAVPGQFLQIRCHETPDSSSISPGAIQDARSSREAPALHPASIPSVLRRPFSIAGMRRDKDQTEIEIIGCVVGPGTAWLDELDPGARVSIIGPLGRGFSWPPSGHHVLLIAGGVGLPPIRWWGEVLRQDNIECRAIYGAQRRDYLPITLSSEPSKAGDFTDCIEEFAREGITAAVTTDDGSCGLQGTVTDCMVRHITQSTLLGSVCVYACGPEPMLQKIGEICHEQGFDCELALERMMGCGMGTCQSCVVRVYDEHAAEGWRYALCCTEGPVFQSKQLIW